MSSKFLINRFQHMIPYRLGAQPGGRTFIKLNSNESPFAPSPRVIKVLQEAGERANHGYYSDQDATALREAIADFYDISPENVFAGNGADEMLSFCFQAYCDEQHGLCFPDITYGFYSTYANAFNIDYKIIPLDEDFQIQPQDYAHCGRTIVIANPNAPTGQRLEIPQIREILDANPDNIVIIDEAYVDFETESCIPLIHEYDNLIVVHTMSKSRNIAGLHIGYAVGNEKLMAELNCLKNCFNPNNLNQVTLDAGVAAMKDHIYMQASCAEKVAIRKWTAKHLEAMGFYVMPSYTNFLFVSHPVLNAADLEQYLFDCGILVRYYNQPRIDNFLRISIGTKQEMQAICESLQEQVQITA